MTFTQQVIATTQRDYVTLISLTVVGYDYILTFSDEVNYIWNKPWTGVSTLFLLARYFGLCFVVATFFYGSSFSPDPTKLCVYRSIYSHRLLAEFYYFQGVVVVVFSQWALFIFTAASSLVMILRVWALCNRPRFILATLLLLYAAEVVASLVLCIVFSTLNNPLGGTTEMLDFSLCVLPIPFALLVAVVAAQLILGTLMCLLVIVRFVKESMVMYAVTKQCQLGHYMNLITGQNTVYLLIVAALSFIHLLFCFKVPITIWWTAPGYIIVFPLVPRFTLSLRALYAHDVQGRRGSGVDTAFGLTYTDLGDIESVIAFTSSGQDEWSEQNEGVAIDAKDICGVKSL